MHMHMLHRDLLLALTAVAIERIEQRRMASASQERLETSGESYL
jgi:hypothetical protein